MPRKTKAEKRAAQDQADAAAIADVIQREGDERRARLRAEWGAHNRQCHGGGECDCEA